MNIHQEELKRKLSALGCKAEFDEEFRTLSIEYGDFALGFQDTDGVLHYTRDMLNSEANEKLDEVIDLHRKIKEYTTKFIAECEDYDMRFKNEHHRKAFNDIIRKKDIKNKELISALYLLTADIKLSHIAKRCCDGNRIVFRDMKLNGCSEEAYTLYCAAKDIYLKTKYLGLYDLSDADIIPFRTFGLIS